MILLLLASLVMAMAALVLIGWASGVTFAVRRLRRQQAEVEAELEGR